jgi:hypothetical protein
MKGSNRLRAKEKGWKWREPAAKVVIQPRRILGTGALAQMVMC